MLDEKFLNYLTDCREKINNLVISELEKRKPRSLYQPIIYFISSGGKRLRAILLLLCAKAIKNDFENEPLNQAIAIELLHNFTLIHDDIMDNSEKRHNKKTLHKKYDLSTAILAGDALLSLAYEYLERELNFNCSQIFSEFTSSLTTVCEGQALDKEFETRKRISIRDYYEMISKKTGALIKATCRIGALTRTNDIYIVDKLGEFGETIGIAFQIQDDLLDVIGVEKKFGKKRGSDLIEGKKTFLLLNAIKKAKGKELKKLNELIENKGTMPDKVKEFIDIYKNLGVIDDTKNEIEIFNSKANNILDELENKIETTHLRQFLSLVINREN